LSKTERKTVLEKTAGYGVGIILSIAGIVILVWVAWTTWKVMSAPPNPDFVTVLLTQKVKLAGLIPILLIYYAVIGGVVLTVGSVLLAVKKRRVPLIEEVTVMLECSSCKGQWREHMEKTQLLAMGYPQVKRLSRRKCPQCAKFTRPKIARTLKTKAVKTTK